MSDDIDYPLGEQPLMLVTYLDDKSVAENSNQARYLDAPSM